MSTIPNWQFPLLVPSFSSRGFAQDRDRLREVTQNNFRAYANFFEVLLVSAFDLYYDYVSYAEVPTDRLIIVDSGGYEISVTDDDSAIYPKPLSTNEESWELSQLEEAWASLPDVPNFIYVNLDATVPLTVQLNRAVSQLQRFRHAKKSFLLKEEPAVGEGKVPLATTILRLLEHGSTLSRFDVFGVTERSLGDSYQERITTLVLLKATLAKLQLSLPIHIFGALDPLSVKVYSLAGGDIFDGLTWLRFAYREGECIYLNNSILRESDFAENIAYGGKDSVFANNYSYLLSLQEKLQKYRMQNDPSLLELSGPLRAKTEAALLLARSTPEYRRVTGSAL